MWRDATASRDSIDAARTSPAPRRERRGTHTLTSTNPDEAIAATRAPDAPQRADQIKSRDRVRDLAEVYTHEREVSAMLGLVPDMLPSETEPQNVDRTFLEPACGHGNFLVEILARKLEFVTARRYGRGGRFEYWVVRCLASIYGIDISPTNVTEARQRMQSTVSQHLATQGITHPTSGLSEAVGAILETNVLCADALGNAAELVFVTYEAAPHETFMREWSRLLEPPVDQPNLFATPPLRDELPVHYSELARQVGPRHTEASREVA